MQYKSFAALIPALLILPVAAGKAQTTLPFPDVPKNHWAYSAMMDMHKRGILVGTPKEYDNSTAEACWKSIVKAMERGNEKVMGELMSEDAWKEYTSGKSVRKERLAYFRRVAKHYREKERGKETQWLPVEETGDKAIHRLAMDRNLSGNGAFIDGPAHLFFVFEKGASGWRLIGRQSN